MGTLLHHGEKTEGKQDCRQRLAIAETKGKDSQDGTEMCGEEEGNGWSVKH